MRSPRTRIVAILAAVALAGLSIAAPAAQAADTTSTNWAGYVASRSGVTFTHVIGSWVQPTATCTAGDQTSTAVWVGLGGYHTGSEALEQVGTAADCSSGTATYSAWYEILPDAAKTIRMTIHAGDRITAAVTVKGTTVRFRLVNHTTGATFTRTLRADAVDVTSAEWIVEAPSLCTTDGSSCQTMDLTEFTTTKITSAKATTTGGHTGTISDGAWAATSIDLVASSSGPRFDAGPSSTAGAGEATTGGLNLTGSSFSVTYVPRKSSVAPYGPQTVAGGVG